MSQSLTLVEAWLMVEENTSGQGYIGIASKQSASKFWI